MAQSCEQCGKNMSEYADREYFLKEVYCSVCGTKHYVGVEECLLEDNWIEVFYIERYY